MGNEKVKNLKAYEFNLYMLATLYVKDGEVLKTRYGSKRDVTDDVIEIAKEELDDVVIIEGDLVTIYLGENLGEYVESELSKGHSPLNEVYLKGNVKLIK